MITIRPDHTIALAGVPAAAFTATLVLCALLSWREATARAASCEPCSCSRPLQRFERRRR